MIRITATIFAACLFGIAVPSSIYSAEIANGIYLIAPDGNGTHVACSTGAEAVLGELVSSDFGEVAMWSLSNQNDRFRVSMRRAKRFDKQKRAAIYVDAVCEIVISNSNPVADGKWEMLTDVAGHANAKKIATGLHVKLQERTHPGHQLRVRWKPVQTRGKIGEPVMLELEIANVGSTTVRFIEGGQQRGARDNQFGFTAFAGSGSGKPIPDSGDPRNFGGIGVYRVLKPDDVFRKQVDLAKWFKFKNADTYQVTAMYEIELYNRDYGARVLWKEYVTGRCHVRIEK